MADPLSTQATSKSDEAFGNAAEIIPSAPHHPVQLPLRTVVVLSVLPRLLDAAVYYGAYWMGYTPFTWMQQTGIMWCDTLVVAGLWTLYVLFKDKSRVQSEEPRV